MENTYVQRNLSSIKHMLNSNMKTIKSIKDITTDEVVTNEQLKAVILVGCASELYREIKDYLTEDESKEVKILFNQINEVAAKLKLQ